jgi:hypothetical protein
MGYGYVMLAWRSGVEDIQLSWIALKLCYGISHAACEAFLSLLLPTLLSQNKH